MKAYVARLKDGSDRSHSSSGGAFYALARQMIDIHGVVCGAEWTDDCKGVRHSVVDNDVDLQRLRGSKYAASCMDGVLRQLDDVLKNGRACLFCGCPCQVMALKKSLLHDNFIAVELICNSVPMPILLKRSVEWIERKKKKKVIDIQMRDSDKGRPFVFKYKLSGHKKFMISSWLTRAYVRLWMSGLAVRATCTHCQAKGRSGADITIGDAWGVQGMAPWGDDGRGLSVLVAHTEHAEKFIENCKDLIWAEIPYQDVLQGNPSIAKSVTPKLFSSPNRGIILDSLDSDGDWVLLTNKILRLGFIDRVRSFIKRFFR